MKQVVDQLQKWNFRLCAVFLLDSQFLIETSKFFAGAMTALSAMVTLELPHVNVLSKMDLLDKKARIEVQKYVINQHPSPPSLGSVHVHNARDRRQLKPVMVQYNDNAHGCSPIWWMGNFSLAV